MYKDEAVGVTAVVQRKIRHCAASCTSALRDLLRSAEQLFRLTQSSIHMKRTVPIAIRCTPCLYCVPADSCTQIAKHIVNEAIRPCAGLVIASTLGLWFCTFLRLLKPRNEMSPTVPGANEASAHPSLSTESARKSKQVTHTERMPIFGGFA